MGAGPLALPFVWSGLWPYYPLSFNLRPQGVVLDQS